MSHQVCYGLSLAVLSYPAAGPGPTQEELRRRVENGVKEFWYFVRSEVKKLANVDPSERQKYTDTLLQDLGHQERWININLKTWKEQVGKHFTRNCSKPVACAKRDNFLVLGGHC